ncbi:DUF2489 domain-containing protein [Aeromonas schubertii]|nr:DUF2489 domain-containing protein [Aeromonas schubertii]
MSLIWLAVAGAIILAGVAAYAASLLLRLRAQQLTRQQAIRARNLRILESVQIIAKAVQEGQCDPSEGAIRLTNLLDALQMAHSQPLPEQYPGLYGLYEKIRHLATHEARSALEKRERMRQDLERVKHEADYNDQIQEDVARLAIFTLPE